MATFDLRPDVLVVPITIAPGGEVRIKGSFYSKLDGAEIDAATTTWPSGAPGGASVDAGGLIDFKRGGFHLKSRDPKTHEVVLVVDDGPAPACDLASVPAPCLALRSVHHAQSHYLTVEDWSRSLEGKITVEVEAPPAYAPAMAAARSPALWGGVGAVALAGVCALGFVLARRRKATPRYKLKERVRTIETKLAAAGPALAAALRPALSTVRDTIDRGRVDPTSREGLRVVQALDKVESHIDASVVNARLEKEQEAADEILSEMEAAMDAAKEAEAAAGPPR